MALHDKVSKLPAPCDQDIDPSLGDLRFRALLGVGEWERLPPATRQRFSKRLADGRTTVYVGKIDEARISRIGWWLAQAARLIGGPLPTSIDTSVPMIVTVTEDAESGGQIWTRVCTRRDGFPQVIHSSKRFAGPTGLEEYIGFGICIALRLHVDDQALRFDGAGYSLQAGHRRLPIPEWLTPGVLSVTHTDLGEGDFRFTLEIVHPHFGILLRQSALFREATP